MSGRALDTRLLHATPGLAIGPHGPSTKGFTQPCASLGRWLQSHNLWLAHTSLENPMSFIHRRQGLLALICLCASLSFAQTAEWPKAKPVSLLVAFAPGSSTDIVARALTQKLNELTGGNFIVDNKGGAGGNIATTPPPKSSAPRPMATPYWCTAWPLRSTPLCMPMQAMTRSKTLHLWPWAPKHPTSSRSTRV